MRCNDILKRLDAWVDRELPPGETRALEAHLAHCPACRKEALAQVHLARALDELPPLTAPRKLSRQIRQAIHALTDPPNLAQWWRHLTLAWRSAVCGATLAGLVCGAVMGTHLAATLDMGSLYTPYQILYDSGRLYP
ncbi:MAG: zf-HC2 domain-containing protein [Desulfotignum sp.]|nr:zf-HC2 domain-containing protein [Desulfotignum sp.]